MNSFRFLLDVVTGETFLPSIHSVNDAATLFAVAPNAHSFWLGIPGDNGPGTYGDWWGMCML